MRDSEPQTIGRARWLRKRVTDAELAHDPAAMLFCKTVAGVFSVSRTTMSVITSMSCWMRLRESCAIPFCPHEVGEVDRRASVGPKGAALVRP